MRALILALLIAFLTAPAHAIPGVTIPFPEDVQEEEDDSEGAVDPADAVADFVLDTDAPVETPAGMEPVPATEAGPWLMSDDYPRPEMMEGSVIRLVWQVQVETMEGEAQGESFTRTLLIGPDFAYDTGETPPVLYDFAHDRRLVANTESGTYRNTSVYGDVRRRLDTYLALSRGGTLEDIPFGPGRAFDRFWLESAMGLRMTPVELSVRQSGGMISVLRAGGLDVFSFDESATRGDPFVVEEEAVDNAEQADDAAAADGITDEDAAETEDEATEIEEEFAGVPTNDIEALLRGDTGEADESGATEEAPAADDEAEPAPVITEDDRHYGLYQPGFVRVFRGWMRHALPVHPDAFAAFTDAEAIPQQFSFVVVSPNSPEGRREVWTLTSVGDPESVFPLPDGLEPGFDGPLAAVAAPASDALRAIDNANPPASSDITGTAERLRQEGELALAYLTLYQDSAHRGQCQMGDTSRAACQALGSLVASGLGNAEFEALFTGLAGLSTGESEAAYEAVLPYLDAPGFGGAAANMIAGNELIAWAASAGAEADLPDTDPFVLLANSADKDAYAPAIYWHLAQAHLAANRADAAWTMLDLGRRIPGGADHELLRQAGVVEIRLQRLAPDFFPLR
ncbi:MULTISPECIES: hypothetical protein [Hyphobacterium]|uniref:Uncharacterized protein n=1 Tax=Hyphobacterium vulgare TaxID=1736751 RepID=A0ABV6ZY72_9PROT